jgi:signal peptidase I
MKNRNGKSDKSFRESTLWEYTQIIGVAFFLVFGFIRPFIIEPFKIPSGSMEDTLLIGDRILVAKFIYGIKIPYTQLNFLEFNKPEVGDVFVFKPPPAAGKTQNFIKRIVGVEGDIIQVKDGDLYRNGKSVAAEEPYVKRSSFTIGSPQNMRPYKIPPGYVFAMGDNRDHSSDSRVWGPVPLENIKGQAFLIYWSWDRDADLLHKIRFSRIARPVR